MTKFKILKDRNWEGYVGTVDFYNADKTKVALFLSKPPHEKLARVWKSLDEIEEVKEGYNGHSKN